MCKESPQNQTLTAVIVAALQLPQYERDVWSYQPYESQHVLAQREYVQRYSAF